MAGASNIEWTERTWNPIAGCKILSPGCANCYAMKMAHRLGANPATPIYHGLTRVVNGKPVWTGEMRLLERALREPLLRRKPTTWFVNSMSDLFADDVPDAWIDRVFAIMALCPQHTFQVLTKRPARMRAYMSGVALERWAEACAPGTLPVTQNDIYRAFGLAAKFIDDPPTPTLPLPNVWLGTSTEDGIRAVERVFHLVETPAAVRFVSAEPLLGGIDFTSLCDGHSFLDALRGVRYHDTPDGRPSFSQRTGKIDLVIVGGENGDRPMHPNWVRQIRDDCAAARTAFFFKQWGSWEVWSDENANNHGYAFGGGMPESGEKFTWLGSDGRCSNPSSRGLVDAYAMAKVGKRVSGRLLDGVEHNAMPEGR